MFEQNIWPVGWMGGTPGEGGEGGAESGGAGEEEVEEERTGWTNVDQQGAVMLCHIVWSHKLLFMFNSIKARNEWRNTHFLFQVYVVKIYSPSFDEVIYRTP